MAPLPPLLLLAYYEVTNIDTGRVEGGGLSMRYDRDWIPKFATKDYVILTFRLFLKK